MTSEKHEATSRTSGESCGGVGTFMFIASQVGHGLLIGDGLMIRDVLIGVFSTGWSHKGLSHKGRSHKGRPPNGLSHYWWSHN